MCQSLQTILPRDLAQLVAMGADAVHPILPLDTRTTSHISEGTLSAKKRAENVLQTFKNGLNLFMACVGVSHFQAYQVCPYQLHARL